MDRYVKPEQVRTWDPRLKGPHGKALCKWCRREVSGHRRTWCSDECVHEYIIRSGSPRFLVEQRDKGICSECGLDCLKLERVAYYLRQRAKSRWSFSHRKKKQPKWSGTFRVKYPWADRHTWEADHKLPVVEGGGGCGMDNLRTLCIPCHRIETRNLSRRRADAGAGRQALPGMEVPR